MVIMTPTGFMAIRIGIARDVSNAKLNGARCKYATVYFYSIRVLYVV